MNHCKYCANWVMDIDDHIVGWCKFHNELRGQKEGWDERVGACAAFTPKVSAIVIKPDGTVKRAKVKQGANRQAIERNREQLLRWHAEGRSCWWMAKSIGISERSSGCVSKWFREQGVGLKAQKHGRAAGGAA